MAELIDVVGSKKKKTEEKEQKGNVKAAAPSAGNSLRIALGEEKSY